MIPQDAIRSLPTKKRGGALAGVFCSALWVVALVGCRKAPERLSEPRTPRIVTLSPSATETVAALGATAWLVGVDKYSAFPPEVGPLPKVGSYIAPNLEAVLRLRPTLVVIDDVHAAQAAVLRDRGVATVECAMHGLADVKSALSSVGARIGRSAEAAAAIARIDAALDEYAAAKAGRGAKVLAVIDREAGGLGNIVAVGPGSWVDELLAVVGASNVLAAAGARYPKISIEEVMRAQPDTIVDLSQAARDSVAAWTVVDVPAVASKRVIAVTESFVIAPSPRVDEALKRLAAVVQEPELTVENRPRPNILPTDSPPQ